MIAFTRLGHYGRLGNQLFQYAYLRTMAQRLAVPFHCPRWDGDDIFDLDDASVRASEPQGLVHHFGPTRDAGFTPEALTITDHTDVEGFFQSDRYYDDPAEVRRWYRFKPSLVLRAEAGMDMARLQESVSVSLRIDGDYANTREYFPLYPLSFYQRAYARLGESRPIVVFADRPDLAKAFFAPWTGVDIRYIDGKSGPDQLYLMTRCRANIITNSTFAWWGGWLNSHPQGQVLCPSSWCRPGVPQPISGILSAEWWPVRGTVPLWDHFQVWRLRHPVATVRRVISRLA